MIKDLSRIGQLKGEFVPENEKLEDKMEAWYQAYKPEPVEKGVETFKQRKHVQTLRTAMVLSLCESDELVVTNEHFDDAIKLIDKVEKNLARGLSSVGRNPYSALLYKVLDYIEANTPIKKGKVMAYFFKDIPPDELSKVFEVLKASGEIQEVTTGTDSMLRITKT